MATVPRCIALVVVALLSMDVGEAAAQDDPRKLFEAGKYRAVLEQTADDGAPATEYLKGLTHLKLNEPDAARVAFGRLGRADEAWQAVGQSAVALLGSDRDAALAAANTAVARNENLAEARYQLGLVLDQRDDHAAAAEAFAKAGELSPLMAYAHYYAGMNYYKARRIDRMAVSFERFLKLAPHAPERPAVESIMRTVRGH